MPPPSVGQYDTTPVQPLDLEAEAQNISRLKRSGSRASLPLSVHPSTPHSDPNTRDGPEDPTQVPPTGEEEDYQWGPSHPCFPHPNPHVPLNSPLFHATKIIRVKRDWMVAGDLAPTFANLYPEVLDPLISEEQFRTIIRKINTELVAAFSPWTMRAWIDALLGVATFWLWDDAGLTGVKSRLKRLEQWLEEWNKTEGAKDGVQIITLRRTGYMTLDFQIPDPHIGIDTGTTNGGSTSRLSTSAAPVTGLDSMRHGDLAPSQPIQDLGTLRSSGMQTLAAAR